MKILLIQLRRLGDLILTTPAISALREHFPGAQIALAVSRECEPLFPAIHGLQKTFLTKRGLRDLSAWMEIRRAGFDCVVDFTRNDRSAWVTFLSGARRRIVSDRLKTKSKFRARFYNEFVDCAMKQMHTADYYLALCSRSEFPRARMTPYLISRRRRNNAPPLSSPIKFTINHSPFSIRAQREWKSFGSRNAGLK